MSAEHSEDTVVSGTDGSSSSVGQDGKNWLRDPMSDRCTFADDREATLVAYLYDDMPHAARMAFAAHLATCEVCRGELDGLQSVRTNLEHWAPPELVSVGTSAAGRRPDLQVGRHDGGRHGFWASLAE